MRIRDQLARRRRIAFLLGIPCWLMFGLAGFMGAGMKQAGALPIVFVAFLGFMGCVLFMLFGLRCPNCKNNLGYTIQYPSAFWKVSDKLKFCPFCGVELDKEIEAL